MQQCCHSIGPTSSSMPVHHHSNTRLQWSTGECWSTYRINALAGWTLLSRRFLINMVCRIYIYRLQAVETYWPPLSSLCLVELPPFVTTSPERGCMVSYFLRSSCCSSCSLLLSSFCLSFAGSEVASCSWSSLFCLFSATLFASLMGPWCSVSLSMFWTMCTPTTVQPVRRHDSPNVILLALLMLEIL